MATRHVLLAMAMVVTTGVAAASPVAARETAKLTLTSTGVEAAARGQASVSVVSASLGRFDVGVQRLGSATSYDLLIGGIKVVTLRTGRGGRAKVRFRTPPRSGRDVVLGFDPRGATIAVRAPSGADVLIGTMPETPAHGDDGMVSCCVPDEDRSECEDRAPEECVAAGGTVSTAPSCLPDPCGATPPADRDVVCCLPDDSGPECEDRAQAACLAAGGSLVEAASCAPNPCAGTPPPDDDIRCCIPGPAGFACEVRSVVECGELGGVGTGPGICAPDSCAGLSSPTPTPIPTATPTPTPTPAPVVCCLTDATNGAFCAERDADACSAEGGVSKGAGVCAPDSCIDVPPPDPSCSDNCWSGFLHCLAGCTSTYCAPFCQFDFGRCLDGCPVGP